MSHMIVLFRAICGGILTHPRLAQPGVQNIILFHVSNVGNEIFVGMSAACRMPSAPMLSMTQLNCLTQPHAAGEREDACILPWDLCKAESALPEAPPGC